VRCDATRENLKALCDGELSRWQSWRVRLHLAHCAACAEELALMQRLHALLLSADPAAQAESTALRSPARPLPTTGRPAIGRLRQVGWLGALMILVVLSVLTWSSTRSSAALAAAIQALDDAKGWRTWHFLMTAPDHRVTETWLRLPDAFREETRQAGRLTELRVQRGKEGWIYLPDQKRAVHAHVPIMDPTKYGTPLDELKRVRQRAQKVGGLKVTETPDRMADGRTVRVMKIEIEYAKHYGPSPDRKDPKTIEYEVIVDAETARLLKWKQGEVTCESAGYDQPLPDSLFTWEPPATVQVSEVGDWWGERLGHTVASVRNERWELTIHAVDLAANGEIWLTSSWAFKDKELNNWGTIPPIGPISDEHGRAYVGFVMLGGGSPTRGVMGYTPLEPRRPTDPLPKKLAVSVGGRTVELTVPPPAAWDWPPKDPLAIAHPENRAKQNAKEREHARRRYREEQTRGDARGQEANP
jgi:outer membrane lipoprotein-sorting protein